MTVIMPKEIKLFAESAIYSLTMQVQETYLDGHQGEWIMDPDAFEKALKDLLGSRLPDPRSRVR